MTATDRPTPPLWQALIPLVVLVTLLVSAVRLFGDGAAAGPSQIALLLAMASAALVGMAHGLSWAQIEDAIGHGIGVSTRALLILLAVGALIGTWILAGIVPLMIQWGLQLLSPAIFYPVSCAICALVALTIGSSWTVGGTIGVALMGVAAGLGLSPEITAGAVISGAYFGDKLSPLSDTTNLAPAVAGSELFDHVRHMLWTTIPSLSLALIGFALLGATAAESADLSSITAMIDLLEAQFALSIWLIIPLLVVLGMAIARVPAFPTIAIGALLGGLFAVIFQPTAVRALADMSDASNAAQMIAGVWRALAEGYSADTGNAAVDKLLSRGGMASMLNTVWLILCALAFGAVMERAGILATLVSGVLKAARSTFALIAAVLATAIGTNLLAADQYLSIVLPGRLYREEFERRGLAPVNLSRALEDAGTITSPLVPWNTCGAYMAATLGVATLDYLPYALFNLVNPLIALGFAALGVGLFVARPNGASARVP